MKLRPTAVSCPCLPSRGCPRHCCSAAPRADSARARARASRFPAEGGAGKPSLHQPWSCPAATAASLSLSGLISVAQAGFCHGPAATLWLQLVIYFLLRAAPQQPGSSEGKGLLPLNTVSLCYQDFSRSPEQSRNYRDALHARDGCVVNREGNKG